jgi:NAD+ diphosphatase
MTFHDASAASTMAYTVNALDRTGNRRNDAEFIGKLRQSAEARLLLLAGDKTRTEHGVPVARSGPVPDGCLFLGLDESKKPWFASETSETPDMLDLRSIAVAGVAPAEVMGRLAQARSLLHWHERHGFCANCGQATMVADAGYRRHCNGCGADHFPRTDPVIIIAVTHGDRLLLGRQAAWKDGMYSTLAGFMEPGETIEDAARREVEEESNIRVGATRIIANQPWPFPSSLMIGLVGEALNDEIIVDPKELETARWFDRNEIVAMRAGTHPDNLHIPPPMAIAYRLIAEAAGL